VSGNKRTETAYRGRKPTQIAREKFETKSVRAERAKKQKKRNQNKLKTKKKIKQKKPKKPKKKQQRVGDCQRSRRPACGGQKCPVI